METKTHNILDIIDVKEKEYVNIEGNAPVYLILDPYSLAQLKEEVGLSVFEEMSFYHGYSLAVKVGEDIEDTNYIKFAR